MLFYEGTIPSKRLDRVIREIRIKAPYDKFQEGLLGRGNNDSHYDSSVRSVKAFFPQPGTLPYTIRLCNEILTEHFPGKMSKKLDLGNTPSLQLLRYNPGDFFLKHKDTLRGEKLQHFSNDLNGYYRILTLCIQLTPEDEYTGGELEVYNNHTDEKILTLKKHSGAYVLFPSLSYHQAKKVTRGQRDALTCWFIGKGKDNVWIQSELDRLHTIENP